MSVCVCVKGKRDAVKYMTPFLVLTDQREMYIQWKTFLPLGGGGWQLFIVHHGCIMYESFKESENMKTCWSKLIWFKKK